MIGFGGYPTLPPLMAARLLGVPTLIHDANAVLGRANRLLARRVECDRNLAARRVRSRSGAGRQATTRQAAAARRCSRPPRSPIARPKPNGPLRLLVVGGSQGARIMADIVPAAIERLEPALWRRLVLAQQVREEDLARVRAVYERLKINAELAPFFTDLPARLAASHLVVSRSGAGTVAELAASAGPRSWCRCRARSTRTSSPMPAC